MQDIWQQFHNLPREIRDTVASPNALAVVDEIERRHPDLDVALLIMRVMVKELPINKLTDTLVSEYQLPLPEATSVNEVLVKQVFSKVPDYVGAAEIPAAPPAGSVVLAAPEEPQEEIKVTPPPPIPKDLPPLPPSPPVTMPEPIKAPDPELIPVTPPPPIPEDFPEMPPTPKPIPMPPLIPVPIRPAAGMPRLSPQPVPTPSIVAPSPPPLKPAGLTPIPPVGKNAPTSAYSEEEAQEIAAQAQKVKNLAPEPGIGIDAAAEKVMAQHQLAFNDELLTRRALTIFKSRLKDIRSSEVTRDMLTRDPKIGGLGMDPDVAVNVVASLEQAVGELKQRGMVTAPLPPAKPPLPTVPKVEAQKPVAMPPIRRMAPAETSPPIVAQPQPSSMPPPMIRRPVDLPPPPAVVTATVPAQAEAPVRAPVQRERVMDRPTISDITRPSKTLGPAGELGSMTLVEFRRLGTGANESTRKLLDRFNQLKNESFKLWADAMAGWRQSEVFQLYLDMGRQSLDQNQSIKDVIAQRARENQPYLSEHEFSALADMNQQLRP